MLPDLRECHPWLVGRLSSVIDAYPAEVAPPPHRLYLQVLRAGDTGEQEPEHGPYQIHSALHLYRPALAVDLYPAGEPQPVGAERWDVVRRLVRQHGLAWGGDWEEPRRVHVEVPRLIREWLLCERLRDLGMIGRSATLESMATLAAIREIERRAGLPLTERGAWSAFGRESWAAVFAGR